MRKELNTSKYNFKSIIEKNCMYVDKTENLYRLVSKSDGQFFLSRPRRFGKSLTLSTLESIFSGNKELFKGLYIYDKQDINWNKYPIIKLALNAMSSATEKELNLKLCRALDKIAKRNNIEIVKDENSSLKFGDLIEELAYKNGKVVILIDEYDKPILDNILNFEESIKIRTFLKSFYAIIKAMEEYLRFTFITGVSKFTQVSVFSDLNNLDDITMDQRYATICGFTQEECENYFAEWIDENAVKNKLSKDSYLDKIQIFYNGFRFSKKNVTLYNPVSFTKTMDQGYFEYFWFATGTPTFLLKFLRQKKYDITKFDNLQLNSLAFSSYEIEKIRVEPLLFQTGYLTIKDYNQDSDLYALSYPNKEVKTAFIMYLTDYFTPVNKEIAPSLIEELRTSLLENNLEKVFNKVLKVFYAKIEYDIKLKHEKYYQTIFYILFMMLGVRIKTEVRTNDGRMDAVVQTDTHIYIFEFKLDKSTKEALNQIKEKEYYSKYLLDKRKLVLVGVNFSSKTGEIDDWETINDV
ncbi:MAG: ATP-binding protein [Candidatus Cloacimonetes bacterium]|nr:ATP-binding protein [Candidatus Cloacimonadota bacterium]